MQVSIIMVLPRERSTKHWKESIINPSGGGEVRPQPLVLLDELGLLVLQQHPDVIFEGVHLDEACHLDVADFPVFDVLASHRVPLPDFD